MTKNLIAALTLILASACSNKQATVTKDTQTTTLSGVYVIGGFEMHPNKNLDSLKNNGVINFGEIPFNFLDNDTVKINPEFGMRFFGDSIFKFEVTKTNVIFTNGSGKIEMPYKNDGIIRLNIENRDIKRLDLIKPQ